MMESKKWTLNKEDIKQLAIKFAMLAVAAVLPVLIEDLKVMDFGKYQEAATVVIFMLTYASQRLLKGKG